MIEPVVQISLRAALSLLFLIAALHKGRDIAAFRDVLNNYRLLPPALGGFAAIALIAAELGTAAALLWFGWRGPAFAAAFLFALYGAAIAINIARGRHDIDCGCGGPARRQRLSAGLVIRNAVLCLAAVVSASAPGPRALTWIDGVTIGSTVTLLAVLYLTADTLLANARHERRALTPPSPQAPAAEVGGGA